MGATTQSLPPHLLPDREIHVIVSILSGQRNAQLYYDETLKPFLNSHQLKYSTHITKSTQTIIDLTRSLFIYNARKGVKQTILLLSGDGGMIDIINTIATTLEREIDDSRPPSIFIRPVICLFPQGTANALAWSSGVAADPINTLLNGHTKLVPIFEATFSHGARLVTNEGQDREVIISSSKTGNPKLYGAVVFSWGLHASLVARSDTTEYRKHGIERFKLAAAKLLEQNHIYKGLVRYKPDPGEWEPLNHGLTNVSTTSSLKSVSQTTSNTSNTSSNISQQNSETSSSSSHPTQPNISSSQQSSHSYILATLVSNLEETFLISPSSSSKPSSTQTSNTNSNSNSNSMHLIAIPHLPTPDLSRLAHLPYQNGAHINEPEVTYQKIDGLQIDFLEDQEEWREVCVDGKIVVLEKGGWVEVRRVVGRGVVDIVVV